MTKIVLHVPVSGSKTGEQVCQIVKAAIEQYIEDHAELDPSVKHNFDVKLVGLQ